MKFNVMNLGCKVNAYEAESTAVSLEENGFVRVGEDEQADFSVIYTCAVTNMAARKSRKVLHRIQRDNPDGFVVVAGCYSQVAAEDFEDVAVVIGTRYKNRLPELIRSYIENRKPVRMVDNVEEPFQFENQLLDHFETRTRAFLKIQDGCNQFCSYCVIPFARGRERSMRPEDVLSSAEKLFHNHREIVLSGIHTGRYGREFGMSLADLIEELLETAPEDARIRISSIEITEIDDHLIELMRKDHRVARHLHIPLQSGCDTVLSRMNRPYTTAAFMNRIKEIRKTVPGLSVSTDVIVGFQGESEEEFRMTYDFLKTAGFSFLHVFPFSMRSGTAAEKMDGTVPGIVKKQRVKLCTDLSAQLYDQYKQKRIGETVDILVETKEEHGWFGHSSDYLPVYLEGEHQNGRFVRVKLLELKDHVLYGREETGDEAE